MEFYVFNGFIFEDAKWRRGQDSNLQAVSRGSFQDYCLTN